MTSIKSFDSVVLNVDQILFKKILICVIYYTEYFRNLDCKNSLYLVFNNVDACIEENNGNKYLIFASKDKYKEELENYTELWDEVRDHIEIKY